MKRNFFHICNLFWTLTLLLSMSACNNEDDVLAIFTGKTWRVTYNPQMMEQTIFNGNTETITNTLNILNKGSNFTISFDGSEIDGAVGGTFTATGTNVTFTGEWSADGKSREMTLAIRTPQNYATIRDNNVLGNELLDCLRNITHYEGDSNNLYLYYEGGDIEFMPFHPDRSE